MSELYGTALTGALTQAFAGTAATVAGAGALGFFLSKDLAPWMRPLIFVSIVNIFLSLLNIFSGR